MARRQAVRPIEVANRIYFTVNYADADEAATFAELLNHLRQVNVIWDLVVMSFGRNKGPRTMRAVEVVIYKGVRKVNAVEVVTAFLKGIGIKYRLLGDLIDAPTL
jgi:hypothetical protein